MPGKALFIVPSQGEDVRAFYLVAMRARADVYASNATIVRTTVTETEGALSVSFKKDTDEEFTWEGLGDLSSVITVSHAYMCDGPNLAAGDGGHQPWGSENLECKVLSEQAKTFWTKVGASLKQDGKIILMGCAMGAKVYAKNVAIAAQRTTYASDNYFAAGDEKDALQYLTEIEDGIVAPPMVKFSP